MQGIHNPHNDRDDTSIWVIEDLPGRVPLPVDQDSIPHSGVGIVEGDEVPLWFTSGQDQRLDDQQAPILIVRVADGGDNRSGYFSNYHRNQLIR